MWQKQVDINRCFNEHFKLNYCFKYKECVYRISGIGYTHVICTNDSLTGVDTIFSKKLFLKKFI